MKFEPISFPARTKPAAAIVKHIALLGNFPPRRCGLATFTQDSYLAITGTAATPRVDLYVMDDGAIDQYPPVVSTLIAQGNVAAYQQAADDINRSGAQALWIQHEFGIFGGEAGSHLLALINRVRVSIVATLHTVLEKPSPSERSVMQALMDRADTLIVMVERGRQILCENYQVDADKIIVIPHGVPDRAPIAPHVARERLGLAQRPTIFTFGLLAPDKGIEDMVEAMPRICAAVPDAHYIVLGATHPHLLKSGGDDYRQRLQARIAELGIEESVTLLDRFVELEELTDWLAAADVYVTPYRNPAQITSGTLSYAVAMGKAVVSTPYVHAQEILADGHGFLVPFRSPDALADTVAGLLTDDQRRLAVSQRAYALGRSMLWSRNAEAVMSALGRALNAPRQPGFLGMIPAPKFAPIARMTDDTGMLQHSLFGVADRRHGYCIDDNARALMLMSVAEDLPLTTRTQLADVYASFVQYAWNRDARSFRNFMSFERTWLESEGSEDSNGRTLWALGLAAARAPSSALRRWAASLHDEVAETIHKLGSPRARAFALLGAVEMWSVRPGDPTLAKYMRDGADWLANLMVETRRPDWKWFEIVLSYDNTRLPEALIRVGQALGDDELCALGLEALDWISERTTGHEGQFQPVGTRSFGEPMGEPALFDQQPLEAWAVIEACSAAFDYQPDLRWLERSKAALEWFLGRNVLSLPLIDTESGECGDGLTPFEANLNNGAESVLAWQVAYRAYMALRTNANARGYAFDIQTLKAA